MNPEVRESESQKSPDLADLVGENLGEVEDEISSELRLVPTEVQTLSLIITI